MYFLVFNYRNKFIITALKHQKLLRGVMLTFHEKADQKSPALYIYKQKIDVFDDYKHCVKCFCEEDDHIHLENEKKETCIIINTGNFYSVFAKENLFVTVELLYNESQNFEHIRKSLECPVCLKYMVGHIHSCETGHVICSDCMNQLSECPSCRQNLLPTIRCYALEKVAVNVIFPCEYDSNGCGFKGKLENIKEHEENCTFQNNEPSASRN